MKKIKKEQLDIINKQQTELHKIISDIGMLEAQKHAALHSISKINEDINEFKGKLEEEYGQVNIDLVDGSYKPIEETKDV